MVQELLDFKEKLDNTLEDAFARNEKFINMMKVCVVQPVFCSDIVIFLFTCY